MEELCHTAITTSIGMNIIIEVCHFVTENCARENRTTCKVVAPSTE